jgi:hypothetical protein
VRFGLTLPHSLLASVDEVIELAGKRINYRFPPD